MRRLAAIGTLSIAVVALGGCLAGPGSSAATSVPRDTQPQRGHLVIRSVARAGPTRLVLEVTCESPTVASGNGTEISAATAQRRTVTLARNQTRTTRVNGITADSECTVDEISATNSTLTAVFGGDPVSDAGGLTGVRARVPAGAIVSVKLVNTAAAA
jgi:hypothetical protein